MPWLPQGDANLAYWCRLLADTPVVAIGGMDAVRARRAMRAGAAGVAVVGAITRAEDPAAAITALVPRDRRRSAGSVAGGDARTRVRTVDLERLRPGRHAGRVTGAINATRAPIPPRAIRAGC